MHTQTVQNAYKESDIVAGTEYPKNMSDPLESRSNNWKCSFTDLWNLFVFGYLDTLYINLMTGLSIPAHIVLQWSAITGLFLAEDLTRDQMHGLEPLLLNWRHRESTRVVQNLKSEIPFQLALIPFSRFKHQQ